MFDGVPSQHDGKDAAVIAELAALGKSQPWPYRPPSAWEQELAYWVEWLDAQTHILTAWLGRIEALLCRHWPEATQVLRVSSATLLRALEMYGGPAGLAADSQAAARLQQWGFPGKKDTNGSGQQSSRQLFRPVNSSPSSEHSV